MSSGEGMEACEERTRRLLSSVVGILNADDGHRAQWAAEFWTDLLASPACRAELLDALTERVPDGVGGYVWVDPDGELWDGGNESVPVGSRPLLVAREAPDAT